MTDTDFAFLGLVRSLVLPIPANAEGKAVEAMRVLARDKDLEPSEISILLKLELQRWGNSGVASQSLKGIVRDLLLASLPEDRNLIADKYFDLYEIAVGEPDNLPHLSARYLLSHLNLIVTLAKDESMSASQIVRILNARDERIGCSWKIILGVLLKLGVANKLDFEAFKQLFESDRLQAESVLADSPLADAIESVGRAAMAVGYDGDLGNLLQIVLSPDGTPIYSILEILHYQVSLAEFFDHALTYSYEFSPRGKSVNWMHAQYPEVLTTGKQPFLNIAKSVYQITEEWALPKDDAREALALARILRGLEQLGFAARKQICTSIRYLIHRVISGFEGEERFVPADLHADVVLQLLEKIASEPTESRGILEQRSIDAVQWCRHPASEGWKISSIGESVNATNLSGLKFGDCEFVNLDDNEIAAFEVHGGVLKDIYVEDHLETLSKVCQRRLPVLEQQFEIGVLTCDITFVAHRIELECFDSGQIRKCGPLSFRLSFETFKESFMSPLNKESLQEGYQEYIARPLNNKGLTLTPQSARDRLLSLIE